MPPDVSVIIATYNVERYIARAVESVLAQAGPAVEIIIVDDCSTDGTWAVISKLADPRIRAKRLDANSGPSVARNAAIAMANGEWIAVLDGDDRFLAGRLGRCLARAISAQADMVVDNLTIQRESDDASFPMFPDTLLRQLNPLDLARFIAGNRLFAQGHSLGYLKPVFRAGFLRRHGLAYDPALRIGEDYLLFAEALAKGAVCVVEPAPGYVYTVRSGSISHRLALGDIERMADSDAKFQDRYRLEGKAAEAQRSRDRSLREAYAYTLLIEALKRRDPAGVAKAIRHCPAGLRHLWQPVWARLSRLR